eukprot:Skav205408  [mRNA]  locus=scaffold170:20671:26032:- [translate_table: standard]
MAQPFSWQLGDKDSFNQDNAQAILAGEKFQQAPNLYALDTYVVTPMSKPGWCAARDQDSNRSIPWAVLKLGCKDSHCNMRVFLYLGLFALNQHAVADEVGEKPMQGPFNAALAQAAGGAVMAIWAHCQIQRAWSVAQEQNKPRCCKRHVKPCGACRPATWFASCAVFESRQIIAAMSCFSMMGLFCQKRWGHLDFPEGKAQSSVAADKYSIWAHVAGNAQGNVVKSHGAEHFFHASTKADLDLDDLYFSDFNQHMRSLLSTSLVQTFLASSDFRAAARCCLHGASINEKQLDKILANFDSENDTANWLYQMLKLTAETGNASLLRSLLRLRATESLFSIHVAMRSLLVLGAQSGHEPIVKLLLENGADARLSGGNDGMTALMPAARGGHDRVVKLLLEHGADARAADNVGFTALMEAALWGHEHVAKLLLEHGAEVTALSQAAFGGHEPIVKLLLEHGADARAANNDGVTALMEAAFGGHELVVKLLLEHGADARAASNDGVTALMGAAAGGHERVVKLLLEHGADARAASNDGVTALMGAAAGGHERVVKLLLEHGADARAASNDGVTALMGAAAGGHERVVKLLLEHGADVRAARNNGETALMAAAQGGHEPIVKLLLEHGADAMTAQNDGVTAMMGKPEVASRQRRQIKATWFVEVGTMPCSAIGQRLSWLEEDSFDSE